MKTIKNILLLIFLNSCVLSAQIDTSFYFNSLTIEDNLSQSTVSKIIQDDFGFMWFATEVGTDRFDGMEFTLIDGFKQDLSDEITVLFENKKKGYLLVGTEHILYTIDYKTNEAKKVTNSQANIIYASNNAQKDQVILFSPDGVFTFSNNIVDSLFSFEEAGFRLASVVHSSNGHYIFGTDKGLYQFSLEDKSLNKFSQFDDDNISLVYPISNGDNLYICIQKENKSSLYLFSISNKFSPQLISNTSDINIKALCLDQNNRLWIGTEASGIFLYDNKENKIREIISESFDIKQRGILSIYQSTDGVLWFGTDGGGIYMIQEKKQTFKHLFKSEKGFNNHTWAILPYKTKFRNYILAGTRKDGIAVINVETNKIEKWILPNVEIEDAKSVFSFAQKDNDLYIGTGAGLFKFNLPDLDDIKDNIDTLRFDLVEFSGERIPYLFLDKVEKELWVHQRDGEESTLRIVNIDNMSSSFFDSFQNVRIDIIQKYFNKESQEHEYWIGTDQGLKIVSEDLRQVISVLSTSDIFSIYNDGNTLNSTSEIWLGTVKEGLFKLNHNTDSIEIDTFYEGKGFFEKVIYSITGDKYNNLWFSTNHGLYKFDIETEIFNCYRKHDGLASDEFNSDAMAVKGDTFYFGGINGVTCFIPLQHLAQKESNDKMAIKYSTPDSISLKSLSQKKNNLLSLERDFRHIKITPLLLNYHHAMNNQFRYSLNGKEFQNLEKGKSIEFFTRDLRGRFGNTWNTLELKESNSNWQKTETLKIYVGWHSGEIYTIIFLGFITLLGSVFTLFLLHRRHLRKEKLINIHERINEISRLKTIDEICTTALQDFIKTFKVDYAVISLIDFNERKLKVRYAQFKNEDPIVESITTKYFIKLDELMKSSIFYKCLETQKTQSIDDYTSKQKGDFHSSFFKEKFHFLKKSKFDALFIPMIHRSGKIENTKTFVDKVKKSLSRKESNNEGDIPLGVIEVGFLRDINLKLNHWELESQKINIELYIDNCAQPFYRALISDKEKELFEKVIQPQLKINNPIIFLKGIQEGLVKIINADYSGIAFKTCDYETINFIEKKELLYGYENALSNMDDSLIEDLKYGKKHDGICRYVLETGKPFCSNNISNNKDYIGLAKDIRSELALPLIRNNIGKIRYEPKTENIIGVLALSSTKLDFFNKVQIDTLQRIVDRITDLYLKKKLHYALGELSQPYNIFSKNVEPIYDQIISALSEYFDSKYISIWERTISEWKNTAESDTEKEEKEKVKFILNKTFDENFIREYQQLNLREIEVTNRKRFKEEETYNIQSVKKLNKDSRIYQLCDKKDFKSYIILRVAIENDYEIFINVFSKRKLDRSFRNEDKIFIKQIIRKAEMAIQSAKLVKVFKTTSKSLLKKKRSETLQEIVNNAAKVLHVDLVSLFYYESTGKKLKAAGSVFSESFPSTFQKKKSLFADIILKIDTKWIENEEVYISILNDNIKGKDKEYEIKDSKFWSGAQLKSVAAVRLMFEARPLGVMFFNYKNKKDFGTPGAKRFIEGFADWAIIAILNAEYLEDVKRNIQRLEKEAKNIEKQRKEYKNKYEEVQAKMEEIIPQAARTSFYLIIEGMNHDIRNSLLKLKQATINIRNQGDRLREKERISINARIKDIDYGIRLISNLLKLYDFKKIKKEVIDINENIREVIFSFKHRNDNIEFDVLGLTDDIPDLYCYKVELSMIFYNIINNAISAIEDKKNGEVGCIKFYTELKNDNYIIKIEDNGIGISNEKVEKIFEAGYSTKEEGVGIGLYFVREILQNNFYATIKCDSKIGTGTNFTIKIPEFINQVD